MLLPHPHNSRSSSLPQRGHGCVLWPPTWPRRPSPSRASSMWWTVGRSRSGTTTVSLACPPSESPGCPRPQPISGRAERAGRSRATATGGPPWASPVMRGGGGGTAAATSMEQRTGVPSPGCSGYCPTGDGPWAVLWGLVGAQLATDSLGDLFVAAVFSCYFVTTSWW